MGKTTAAPHKAVLALLVLATWPASVEPAQPVTAADYARAERLLPDSSARLVWHRIDQSGWLAGGQFWYRTRDRAGNHLVLVDPVKATQSQVFDRPRLLAALARDMAVDPAHAELDRLELADDGRTIHLDVDGRSINCTLAIYRCMPAPPSPELGVPSPDGTRVAFLRGANLWVRDVASGIERPLTSDGIEDFAYAIDNAGWRHSGRPILTWSPDSRRIATFQQDQRGVGNNYLLSTEIGRPKLETWKYPLPGDATVFALHRVIIDVDPARTVRLAMLPDAYRFYCYSAGCREGRLADADWSADGRTLAFVSTSRDSKQVTLRLADAATGAVRDILTEHAPNFYEPTSNTRLTLNWRYLPKTNEAIWFSKRTGWGHLYLHDAATGRLKHPITRGAWNVTELLHIDARRRLLYVTGVGREKESDPYYTHLYRISLDTGSVRRLTPETAHHEVTLSPRGDMFVDSYSTVSTPPVAVLRDNRGRLLRMLERSDVSPLLAAGWRPPLPVELVAEDGTSTMSALVFTPPNFDPARQYPVVNQIYPGAHHGSIEQGMGFAASRGSEGDAQSLAELGFVVVEIDGRGSTPLRSRAFHESYYGSYGDEGLADQVAGLRQLGRRFAWMDLDRVGIYGLSGGGYATARSMLLHPDVYRAGFAESGNHDLRSYIDVRAEKFVGPPGEAAYADQANARLAANLKGHLMLAHGTGDDNVSVNQTLLLADALIAANKDFDMLMLPNRGHGWTGWDALYMARRRWDYFVRHLQGVEPPRRRPMN